MRIFESRKVKFFAISIIIIIVISSVVAALYLTNNIGKNSNRAITNDAVGLASGCAIYNNISFDKDKGELVRDEKNHEISVTFPANNNTSQIRVVYTLKNDELYSADISLTSKPVTENDCIDIGQAYLSKHSDISSISSLRITNWQNPEIAVIKTLPESFSKIHNKYSKTGDFYQVTFTTKDDPILGPIVLYIDENGILIGEAYRE